MVQAAKELAQNQHTTFGRVISTLSQAASGQASIPLSKPLRNGVPILATREGEVVTLDLVRRWEEADGCLVP